VASVAEQHHDVPGVRVLRHGQLETRRGFTADELSARSSRCARPASAERPRRTSSPALCLRSAAWWIENLGVVAAASGGGHAADARDAHR